MFNVLKYLDEALDTVTGRFEGVAEEDSVNADNAENVEVTAGDPDIIASGARAPHGFTPTTALNSSSELPPESSPNSVGQNSCGETKQEQRAQSSPTAHDTRDSRAASITASQESREPAVTNHPTSPKDQRGQNTASSLASAMFQELEQTKPEGLDQQQQQQQVAADPTERLRGEGRPGPNDEREEAATRSAEKVRALKGGPHVTASAAAIERQRREKKEQEDFLMAKKRQLELHEERERLERLRALKEEELEVQERLRQMQIEAEQRRTELEQEAERERVAAALVARAEEEREEEARRIASLEQQKAREQKEAEYNRLAAAIAADEAEAAKAAAAAEVENEQNIHETQTTEVLYVGVKERERERLSMLAAKREEQQERERLAAVTAKQEEAAAIAAAISAAAAEAARKEVAEAREKQEREESEVLARRKLEDEEEQRRAANEQARHRREQQLLSQETPPKAPAVVAAETEVGRKMALSATDDGPASKYSTPPSQYPLRAPNSPELSAVSSTVAVHVASPSRGYRPPEITSHGYQPQDLLIQQPPIAVGATDMATE
ncbi:unnamed protein product, partial [Sphacelaria rigidula]